MDRISGHRAQVASSPLTEGLLAGTNNNDDDPSVTNIDDADGREEGGRGRDQEQGAREDGAQIQDECEEADSRTKGFFGRGFRKLLCIFPKVERLSWGTFAVLTVWSAILPSCFIAFFTQMGIGEHIYYTISNEMGEYASVVALSLAVFMFTLYILDADEWTSCGSVFFQFCMLVIVCGVVFLVLLLADRAPFGMVCLFVIFHPIWLIALKLMCYRAKDTRTFVSWLSGPLIFISMMILVAWTAWVFSDPDNAWNKAARVVAAERAGCAPDYEDYPDCRKEPGSEETCFYVEQKDGKDELKYPDGCEQSCTSVYSDCADGFMLWVGPVLISMTTLFLSFFCTFLRTEGANEKDALNFGAIWIFLIVALWVTTSLAGTAAGVTAALAALTLASFVASAMFIAASFSKEERDENAKEVLDRLKQKYGKHLDVSRALFVVTCAPIVIIYFGFSMVNQLIRRIGIFPCSQPPGEDGSDRFTTRTRKHVDRMKSWDRANVYTFAIYWGIAFVTLQVVVAQLTTVFLSWIIEKTAGISFAVVTAIMCGVGVMMFLLPPVPGVPVYLTLGIVLPAEGHKLLGWAGSVLYCSGVGLLLKLFSSALQQKGIGQNLSHYVKVRQFVGINSDLMKAMRLVLKKPGLSVPKVSILIGGPDWPTSVLCGIMKLSLPQIMLGTLPIIFLIAPTCLSGQLLYMASLEIDSGNPEFPWAGTVSAITLSLTAAVQFGATIVAAYYLEQAADKQKADIEAIGDDIEVKEADDKEAHLKKCYRDVTQWNEVPIVAKLLLQTSLGCIIASSYMVQLFSDLCFIPYSLTDTIDSTLDGNVANLFLPLGWVAVGLFCLSTMLVYLFQIWGQREARKLANGDDISTPMGESPIEATSNASAQ